MKAIEERAKEFAPDPRDPDYILYSEAGYVVNRFRDAYIAGATEQKAIDIDKACEWLKNNLREYGIILFGYWESDFRKAMEE